MHPSHIRVDPRYAEVVAEVTPPSPELDAFTRDAYAWLLHAGQVTTFYSQRDTLSHTHLLACGVDLAASEPVECAMLASFGDSDHTSEEAAVIGRCTCSCGEVRGVDLTHPPVSVAALIRAVEAHAISAATPRRLTRSSLQVGALCESRGVSRMHPGLRPERTGFWSVHSLAGGGAGLRPEIRLQGAAKRSEILPEMVVVEVFGELTELAPPGAWT